MELLIVMSIIAIITAIGLVSYAPINRRSRDAKRKSDLEQVRSALEMYRTDNGQYPLGTLGAFQTLQYAELHLDTLLVPTYLPSLPSDPKGTKYYYYANIVSGNFYSYCLCAGVENAAEGKNDCGRAASQAITNDTTFAAAYCLRNP